MSNKLDEIKELTTKNIMQFIGFWSNRGNVECSDSKDIQSDLLFYLNSLMYYKQQAEERGKALEYIADPDNSWENLPEYARKALGKEQPNDHT